MPGQQRLRVDHRHHFRQGAFPEPCAEFSQRGALPVSEPHSSGDLLLQHAVFCDTIFAPQQQALVHRSRDRGEVCFPLHSSATWS